MSRVSYPILFVLAAVALAAGCSDSRNRSDPLDVGDDVSAGEMAAVALESDLMSEQLFGTELDAADPGVSASADAAGTSGTATREITFSRSRSCRGGGTFEVEGRIRLTFDRETGVMEAEGSGTRTRTDCTFARESHTYTVNGSARWEIFRRRVHGVPDGPQTSHWYGSFGVVRSDGAERFCEFDITVVRDPEARTRTLEGTICGTTVTRTVTWTRGD